MPMDWDDRELEDILKDVVYVIEANSFERFMLWKEQVEWEKRIEQKDWVTLNGFHETVGNRDGDPVMLALGFARILGKLVMFVYGCSRLVDTAMIDIWLDEHVPDVPRTDGMNWNHCYKHLRGDAK